MISQLAILIFLVPLAAFVVMALLHKRLPRHGDWLATGAIGLSLLASLAIFASIWRAAFGGSPATLVVNQVFDWLPMKAGLGLQGGFMVDRLTAVMLVVVTLVSFLVHLFSSKYMAEDIRYGRYYCGLLLFTASMLALVLANNLLYLYMAWEMVGLSSYLLIGHWYEKKSASNAAIKAFITTRVGDVGMFIGIMICYFKVGSLQYADLFAAVKTGLLAGNWQTIAGLGIFLGAMGKSAQFPLHVWLPDAMEGPTPVSALIHAATMVAAGVYLTGRLLPMFDERTLLFIAYTGGITALFAATIALVQDDIKKVLAYSTVSQLGYMIMALGVGGYVSGLFHLTTHAFFKAGLFLGSGAVIHAMHHEQSMSKYGGLWKKMPKTAFFYLLATLALCGVPPFAGFWSKDKILGDTLAFSLIHKGHWFLPVAGFATAFMTAFYMFRQYFLTFTGKPRDHHAYEHAHDGPWQMLVPLAILGALSVVGGGFGSHFDWFKTINPQRSGIEQVRQFSELGYNDPLIHQALGAEPAAHEPAGEGEGEHENPVVLKAHSTAMSLSIVVALSGILLGWLMYFERKDGSTRISAAKVATTFKPIHTLLWNKYYFDEFYNLLFVMSTCALGRFMAAFDRLVIDSVVNFVGLFGKVAAFVTDMADRLIVDDWFVMGSARGASLAGEQLSRTETGRVRQYLLFTVVGLVVVAVVCIYVF
ncbi:NADH-quinone oxidoreductase subunit L [uncultured Desulfobulbus sp.]|uniref:NADH-quinone oxidoreductase subunit L n=1 Tax=uncultured Desulfobulbus sp. TaxID=239745 RepID=UPI0029C84A1E|nr:NADH-quinone oxidoreductase subunit L [uncultured Desulfobulbus sp.]